MATKLSEIIQKADRESASAAPSFLTKDGASKLKQMQREQEAKDNKLRAEVAKKLNLQDNDETFVQGMYKKIPTNVRLLVENIVGVDSPITAKDFTKEELIEMAFLAEKTRLSNLRTENRYKRILKSESEKGPPSLEDKDVVDDYKDMIESFEKTRGKTSVNPYIQSNKKIVDANYLDSISKTFTSPSYRIATSLGKYNVYDKDNKELNIKDTYNFNKKERNLPSSFTGALKQMMASPELAGEYLANFLRTEDRDVDINIPKKMNKGGTTMSMNKQMEMFDEGGLKEEGGTVDPVSGNDVPPGSTQEEVRDDIPAQLSEGEFVFPADVVRFIGLEKLMMMRQEAKAGLQRMEDMGQMGNSEEATMPDDMPFDINDLDMEDEREYNKGGVVEAATGTFVNQGTNVTSVPSQFAGMNLPSFNPNINTTTPVTYNVPTIPSNVSGYTPKFTGQTGQSSTTGTPSFQTLIGNNPGRYDEMREYKNDAGQTLNIPFKNGQPIYPIPEGYSYVDPEAIKTDDPTTEAPITDTTRVTESQDSNDNDDNLEGDLGGARTTIGGIEYAIQYNLDGTVGLQSIENYKATGKRDFQTASTDIANAVKNQTLGQIVQLGKIAGLGGLAVAEIVKKATGIDVIPSKIEKLINSGEDASEKLKNTNLADVYDMGKAYLDKEYEDREGKGLTGQGLEGLTERQMREMQAQMQFGKGTEGSRFDKRKATSIKIQARKDLKAKEEAEKIAREKQLAEIAERTRQLEEQKKRTEQAAAQRYRDMLERQRRQGRYQRDDGGNNDDGSQSAQDQSDVADQQGGMFTAVGGLIPKKKPKTKKMKRGGLASR